MRNIDAIHDRLKQIDALPANYRDVIMLCREAIQLYQDLLDDIDQRENFDE